MGLVIRHAEISRWTVPGLLTHVGINADTTAASEAEPFGYIHYLCVSLV